jgi:hypothetical protein
MTIPLFQAVRDAWELWKAVFCVGSIVCLVLVLLGVWLREMFAAKALDGRRQR